jgi:hypothetical protein
MSALKIDPKIWTVGRGDHVDMKIYYRVSADNGALRIRPLHTEEQVKWAIEQSAIVVKHLQQNVAAFFILERKVNITSFYAWLSEADRYVNLGLEKPQYIEYNSVSTPSRLMAAHL